MASYLISVPESQMAEHPNARRLTGFWKRILGEERETICIGRGADSRLYYLSPGSEKAVLVGKLKKCPAEIDVKVEPTAKAYLPDNLISLFKKLYGHT